MVGGRERKIERKEGRRRERKEGGRKEENPSMHSLILIRKSTEAKN